MTDPNATALYEDSEREDNTPTNEQIKQVSVLVARQLFWENAVKEAEAKLEENKKSLFKVRDKDLPELLIELGCQQYKDNDGFAVEVAKGLSMSVPEANKEAVNKWLVDNGYDDIIKTVVSVSFAKGEDADAQALVETLAEINLDAVASRTVHTATLKALVKELMEKGVDVPLALMGGYEYRQSKITPPKNYAQNLGKVFPGKTRSPE